MKTRISMSQNAYTLLMGFLPSIQAIFRLGFIPKKNEIREFDAGMYKAYQRQTGKKDRPMYYVAPKNPKYLQGENAIHTLAAREVNFLKQGIDFFAKYAKDNELPLNDSDAILQHAAKSFPPNFTEGTRFEQPRLHVLRENEKVKTPRELWMDLLEKVTDKNEILTFEIRDKEGNEYKEKIAPGIERKLEKLSNEIDFDEISDFEKIKDKIIIKPRNYQSNKDVLHDYFYRLNGVIALTVDMLLSKEEGSTTTMQINKEIIEQWNLSDDYIFEWAMENTAKLFQPFIIPIDKLIIETAPKDYPAENKFFMAPDFCLEESLLGIYNLFIENNRNAATAVFYPGVMKKLAEVLNDDLYIVITFLEYVIVHPQESVSLQKIKEVAKDMKNDLFADPAEFITNGVYYYSREDDSLKWISP